ncbi:MAG: sigma-70 family RNA polymerase sigma factor [Candidatus Acidiferrales bacterium]
MAPETSSASAPDTTSFSAPHIVHGDDERELVAQARNGSSAAVEVLVDRYECRVFRLAQNITSNYQDAEEVVQNAFVKAFQNLSAFRGDSRFYTWLVRIVVNEALVKIRRRRHKEVSIDDPNEDQDYQAPRQLEDWGPSPEQLYSREELRRILETTIGGLAPAHRVVFQLRDVEGFSAEETARALNLAIATVKTRLRRARLQLRDSLDVYFRVPRDPNGQLRDSRPATATVRRRRRTFLVPDFHRLSNLFLW